MADQKTATIEGQGDRLTIQVASDNYDVSLLQAALDKIATGPIDVENGKITLDSSDFTAVKSILATIGLEVLEGAPDEGVEAGVKAGAEAKTEVEAAKVEVEAEDDAKTEAKKAEDDVNAEDDAKAEEKMEVEAEKEEEVYANAATRIQVAGNYQMVLATEVDNSNAHWILIAGSDPIAKISLSDQKNADSMASVFATNEYGKTIVASFEKNGVAKTLQLLNASVFSSKTVQPKEDVDLNEVKAEAIRHYQRCFAMANVAAKKNVIENPLKAAAFEILSEQNVSDPVEAVEAIFASMDQYLEVVFDRTQKYVEMDQSGLAASEDMLSEMDIKVVAASSNNSSEHKQKLAAGNLPITVPVNEKVDAENQNGIRDLVKTTIASKY